MTPTSINTSTRQLVAIAAAQISSPFDSAITLGDEQWREALHGLADIIASWSPPPAHRATGFGTYVCTFLDPGAGINFAKGVLKAADSLGLSMQAAIHAGEVQSDDGGMTGVAVMAALNVAGLANPGDILMTQPAAIMCKTMPQEFAPAGVWQPRGMPVAMRLYRAVSVRSITPSLSPSTAVHSPDVQNLSQREQEVVLFVARGYSNREIAAEFGIAVGTVERHVANMLKKLQFRSRTELARWAVDRGMIDPAENVV